jgi:hypothetical protein
VTLGKELSLFAKETNALGAGMVTKVYSQER